MNSHDSRLFEPTTRPAERERDEGPLVVLAGALAAARRRSLPLAVWLTLCAGAAAWYLHVTPPSYTATATVILDPKRPTVAMGDAPSNAQAPTLDSAQAESQIQVIRSERLLSSVFTALDLADAKSLQPGPPGLKARLTDVVASLFGRTPEAAVDPKAVRTAAAFDAFMGRVGARRVGQSYVLEVSYTSGDPEEARRLANAIVSAYLAEQVSFKLAAAQNGTEYLQSRVTSLGNEVKVAMAGVAAGEVPASLLPDADARVIGAALEPLARSAPKAGLVLGFAGAFGLLSGLFAVAVLNGLDRRIRSAEQLERAVGLPCLGVLPEVRRRSLARRSWTDMARLARREADGRFAAAVRDTRTSILLAFDGKGGRTIGVTSWGAGAGRSLLAANLAEVVAMSGTPVTLVDANVHRAEGGLTDLADRPVRTGLADSLLDRLGTTKADSIALDPGVVLVPARSAGPAHLFDAYLGAAALSRLIEAWRGGGDVVVDLPALDNGGDARAAAARLDGVVVVVVANRTTTDDVERAVTALARAGANVIGTVLNRCGA